MKKLTIPTQVKCDRKVKERRQQLVEAAKVLFLEKGFHKTTTRDISKTAKLSFGAIYEYIGSKEDILYLLIEEFYDQLDGTLQTIHLDNNRVSLYTFINAYFRAIDRLSGEIKIIYRDLQSLPATYIEYVLSKEAEFFNFVKKVLKRTYQLENAIVSEEYISLLARNLIIQGHMWAFRSWDLKDKLSLKEYIDLQSTFFLNAIQE
ncbi:MAG: TetR/AcrR family transcriptional regulator [Anaerobacillus sp.]|uniref:TetR/AcrR family transcriptional regulator n=1 Tax=Anaerobacillus sp. TaxID=1872506 RepID=UPI00391C5B76